MSAKIIKIELVLTKLLQK